MNPLIFLTLRAEKDLEDQREAYKPHRDQPKDVEPAPNLDKTISLNEEPSKWVRRRQSRECA